jgi:hypothetical protein
VTDFDDAYRKWRDAIDRDPSLSLSSRPEDYTSIPEYKAIVDLGQAALPGILDRLEAGDFLLNEAAFTIAGLKYEDVVPDPDGFYSEQEVSRFLLDRLRGARPGPPSP